MGSRRSKGGIHLKCQGCEAHGMCSLQTKGSVAINECPCQDCLIKGICKEPCEAMNKHYDATSSMPHKPKIFEIKLPKKEGI